MWKRAYLPVCLPHGVDVRKKATLGKQSAKVIASAISGKRPKKYVVHVSARPHKGGRLCVGTNEECVCSGGDSKKAAWREGAEGRAIIENEKKR